MIVTEEMVSQIRFEGLENGLVMKPSKVETSVSWLVSYKPEKGLIRRPKNEFFLLANTGSERDMAAQVIGFVQWLSQRFGTEFAREVLQSRISEVSLQSEMKVFVFMSGNVTQKEMDAYPYTMEEWMVQQGIYSQFYLVQQ